MSVLEEAQALAEEARSLTSGIDLKMYPETPSATGVEINWHWVVTAALHGSNKRLRSISFLLSTDYPDEGSALGLARTSFEIAADLMYIKKDLDARLPKYLKHGLFPESKEELDTIRDRVVREGMEAFPKARWKQLSDVCKDNGPEWEGQRKTFYRFSSDSAHVGAFALRRDYLELFGMPPSEEKMATTLAVATLNHLFIALIASELFPSAIDVNRVQSAKDKCNALVERLAKSMGASVEERHGDNAC